MSPFHELNTPNADLPFTSILVVDDDPDIRTLVRLVLEEEGYPVTEAASGRAALEVLRTHPMTTFVVILDYRMPQMDGWELLRIVTSDNTLSERHTFVLLTANGPDLPQDFRRLLSQHAIPIVNKPFQVDTLCGLVERAAREARHPGE